MTWPRVELELTEPTQQHRSEKREFMMSHSSFVVELATNSVCSFDSQLLSDSTAYIEEIDSECARSNADIKSPHAQLHPLDPPESLSCASNADLETSEVVPEGSGARDGVDLGRTDRECEVIRRQSDIEMELLEKELAQGQSSKWSNSRDYSNAFHACKMDSLGMGSIDRRNSRGSKILSDTASRDLRMRAPSQSSPRRVDSRIPIVRHDRNFSAFVDNIPIDTKKSVIGDVL